jgi:hypothetical protein
MALARCDNHAPRKQRKHQYHQANAKKPVGYPEVQAIICGTKGCVKPAGLIWLNQCEAKDYGNGERIFSTMVSVELGTRTAVTGAKVKVQ